MNWTGGQLKLYSKHKTGKLERTHRRHLRNIHARGQERAGPLQVPPTYCSPAEDIGLCACGERHVQGTHTERIKQSIKRVRDKAQCYIEEIRNVDVYQQRVGCTTPMDSAHRSPVEPIEPIEPIESIKNWLLGRPDWLDLSMSRPIQIQFRPLKEIERLGRQRRPYLMTDQTIKARENPSTLQTTTIPTCWNQGNDSPYLGATCRSGNYSLRENSPSESTRSESNILYPLVLHPSTSFDANRTTTVEANDAPKPVEVYSRRQEHGQQELSVCDDDQEIQSRVSSQQAEIWPELTTSHHFQARTTDHPLAYNECDQKHDDDTSYAYLKARRLRDWSDTNPRAVSPQADSEIRHSSDRQDNSNFYLETPTDLVSTAKTQDQILLSQPYCRSQRTFTIDDQVRLQSLDPGESTTRCNHNVLPILPTSGNHDGAQTTRTQVEDETSKSDISNQTYENPYRSTLSAHGKHFATNSTPRELKRQLQDHTAFDNLQLQIVNSSDGDDENEAWMRCASSQEFRRAQETFQFAHKKALRTVSKSHTFKGSMNLLQRHDTEKLQNTVSWQRDLLESASSCGIGLSEALDGRSDEELHEEGLLRHTFKLPTTPLMPFSTSVSSKVLLSSAGGHDKSDFKSYCEYGHWSMPSRQQAPSIPGPLLQSIDSSVCCTSASRYLMRGRCDVCTPALNSNEIPSEVVSGLAEGTLNAKQCADFNFKAFSTSGPSRSIYHQFQGRSSRMHPEPASQFGHGCTSPVSRKELNLACRQRSLSQCTRCFVSSRLHVRPSTTFNLQSFNQNTDLESSFDRQDSPFSFNSAS